MSADESEGPEGITDDEVLETIDELMFGIDGTDDEANQLRKDSAEGYLVAARNWSLGSDAIDAETDPYPDTHLAAALVEADGDVSVAVTSALHDEDLITEVQRHLAGPAQSEDVGHQAEAPNGRRQMDQAVVQAHADALGLRTLSGRNERHAWDAALCRYGILAGAQDVFVDRGNMSQQQFDEQILAPARDITNPNTWQMISANTLVSSEGLPELLWRLERAAGEDRDAAKDLRGDLTAPLAPEQETVPRIDLPVPARFGPNQYTYRELAQLDPPDALGLGVAGSDAESNLARARVATLVVDEHNRISESAYAAARGGEEPVVPAVFGVDLVAEHRGDLRAVLADERLTQRLHDAIGSGSSVEFIDDEDGARYEHSYVDPDSSEQQARLTELRSAVAMAVDAWAPHAPEITPQRTDLSIPGGPTQPWSPSQQRSDHGSPAPTLRLS